MDKFILFKCIIVFLFVILSFSGLNASVYCWQRKRFYINYILLVWCMTAAIIFILSYSHHLHNEIKMEEELNFKNAVKLYYYINILGGAISYLSQLLNCKALTDFFNKAQLIKTVKYFDIKNEVIHSSALLVLLKIIIFPLVIEISLIFKQVRDDVEDKSLFRTIYVLYPLFVANIIPNCLFVMFVIFRQFFIALNSCLTNVEKEASSLQHTEQIFLLKSFERMQKFCDLADSLDELAEKYSLMCSQIIDYMNLCAMPLLASLMCNLFGVTASLFQQYCALADTLINEENYDVFNALTNGVFLIIAFLEIVLHSWIAHQTIEAVKETGLILKRIKLDFVDVRFRQALDDFSFKILVIDFKIQPLGFLNIDLGILHHVLSTVTSFLLILIQRDLTLRFSLK